MYHLYNEFLVEDDTLNLVLPMFHACMFQIATVEPMITGLQEALPKSIGLLPFDGGVTGNVIGLQSFNQDLVLFFSPLFLFLIV